MNQKERWRADVGGASGGGTVSTAGNLVIQVVPDGRLMVYTADKGEKVMEIQTGLRGGMSPPITYMLDGKQYLAVYSGYGGDARGMQGGLNRAFPGEFPEVPEGGAVWLFALDGR